MSDQTTIVFPSRRLELVVIGAIGLAVQAAILTALISVAILTSPLWAAMVWSAAGCALMMYSGYCLSVTWRNHASDPDPDPSTTSDSVA